MPDLVIRNARVITPRGVVQGGEAVDGQKISVGAADSDLPRARDKVDAPGMVLLPELIHPHCHMGLEAARGQRRAKFEAG